MYSNKLECRACGQSQECPLLHTDNSSKVKSNHLFTENTFTLKYTVKRLQQIMKKLEETETNPNPSGNLSTNGRRILADLGNRTLN